MLWFAVLGCGSVVAQDQRQPTAACALPLVVCHGFLAARLANMADRRSGEASGSNGRGGAAFRVQNQIRRNAQDMQEYLADLGSWERSIKKKDK